MAKRTTSEKMYAAMTTSAGKMTGGLPDPSLSERARQIPSHWFEKLLDRPARHLLQSRSQGRRPDGRKASWRGR